MFLHIVVASCMIVAVLSVTPCQKDDDCKNSPDGEMCIGAIQACGMCVMQITCQQPNSCINGLCVAPAQASTSQTQPTNAVSPTASSTVAPTTAPTTASNPSSCKDLADNCKQLSNLCQNTFYKDLMSKNCAQTCGQCSGASSTCVDVADNCSQLSAFCTNALYEQMLRQKCAKTCSYCGSSSNGANGNPGNGCTDKADNCAQNAPLCNNAIYAQMMSELCAKTCRRC